MIVKVIIVAILTIIFSKSINSFPLRNWDEAWYAEIIKNMASGNYSFLVPFFNGQYYFDKPPVYFWLSLPIFKLFGPGEWQARLISAVASVLASFLTYLIAKKLFGKIAAIFAVLAFVTFGQVVVRFAGGNLDALMISLFLLAFYFFLKSDGKPFFANLAGIALGLSTLVKGWLPSLFPLTAMIIYCLLVNKKNFLRLPAVIITALILALPYYLLGVLKFGDDFTNSYLLKPEAGLLRSPLASFSPTYLYDFARDVGLWWLVILPALAKYSKYLKLKGQIKIQFALLLSVFAQILPLNFLSEKLGWYNLAAYPFAATIIGNLANYLIKKNKILTPMLIIFILIAQIFIVIRIENIHPDRSKVGASLGIIAKNLIPKDEKIILNDKDFTSFLYYSDHQEVLVALDGGGKDWEWWILSYNQLDQFIGQNSHTWLITQDTNLPIAGNGEVKKEAYGYQFIRY